MSEAANVPSVPSAPSAQRDGRATAARAAGAAEAAEAAGASAERREGKRLIEATRPFQAESVARSWAHTLSTLAFLAGALALAALLPYWPARLAASILAGLLVVRGFILYHDYMHGALLRRSAVAKGLMSVYGVLVLTPPRVWKQTHNYHHANNAKIIGSHVGSYPVLTLDLWQRATAAQRLMYKVARHPLTVFTGYFGIFLWGMCASSFLRRPSKNWDSLVSLVLHLAIVAALWVWAGVDVLFFAYWLPLFIACGMGAYLFYAQHNFEGVHLQPREKWSYTKAAIDSSSYMKLGPVMNYFTGSIGYHHVHHLNPSIPFYRLRETMDAIPELLEAKVTSLWPGDIARCFRLKLWDPAKEQMVGYPRRASDLAGTTDPAE